MVGGPYFLASLAYEMRSSRRMDAGEIATIAGAAFAIPAGIRIIVVGLADRGYILIGPLIVMTGIVVAVGRIFRNIRQTEETPEGNRTDTPSG